MSERTFSLISFFMCSLFLKIWMLKQFVTKIWIFIPFKRQNTIGSRKHSSKHLKIMVTKVIRRHCTFCPSSKILLSSNNYPEWCNVNIILINGAKGNHYRRYDVQLRISQCWIFHPIKPGSTSFIWGMLTMYTTGYNKIELWKHWISIYD